MSRLGPHESRLDWLLNDRTDQPGAEVPPKESVDAF
jgi:hypothetical protein